MLNYVPLITSRNAFRLQHTEVESYRGPICHRYFKIIYKRKTRWGFDLLYRTLPKYTCKRNIITITRLSGTQSKYILHSTLWSIVGISCNLNYITMRGHPSVATGHFCRRKLWKNQSCEVGGKEASRCEVKHTIKEIVNENNVK